MPGLSNAALRDFGRNTVEKTWFPGLPDLFEDLRNVVEEYRDVSVEFHIISGGLQPIIEGCPSVQKYVSGVYACQLAEGDDGMVAEVRRCVTFTEKTRFLFEINKGIAPADAQTKPHLVNEKVDEGARPVPLQNMTYVGDGLTDIPCFSLIEKNGGLAFAVFKRGEESAKQQFQQLLATHRVSSMHSPDFRPDGDLGAMLRLAVGNRAAQIQLGTQRALA